MKLKILKYLSVIPVLCVLGCAQIKKPAAISEREEWINSFHDSIQIYQQKTSEIESKLNDCNNRIIGILENFEYVSNPRQVEGYYILKGWNSRLPFTSTGIYARITKSENLELIATLSGSTFNRIIVTDGDSQIESPVVPNDQALNYRHGSYNTVCFSGHATDSVIEFIAQHHNENIKLQFIEGNKKVPFIIPSNEKQMIAETWNLFSAQIEQKSLQKEIWINSRKIATYRRMLETADSLK